jgi:hypothetical protein
VAHKNDDSTDETPGQVAPGFSLEEFTTAIAVAMKAAMDSSPQTMTPEAIAMAVGAAIAAQAETNAQAMKKALKPENDPAPLISAFNPRGDRDFPRPKLRCEFTLFDGIPLDGTTDTYEELELLNQLVGGEYWVTKSDGSPMKFKVREIRNDLGVLRRIDLSFPYRDATDAASLMPMVVWLREIVAQIKSLQPAVA